MNPLEPTSPISNHWGECPAKKLKVEHLDVFVGTPGRAYSHQAQIVSSRNRLYATWSLGIRDEEGPGEWMALAISDDGGDSWSEPLTVAPSRPGQYAPSVIVSAGLRVHDGMLVAYYGEWERYGPERGTPEEAARAAQGLGAFNVREEIRVSRDEGRSWSEPSLLMPNFAGFMPPETLRGGRLLIPSHLTYAWTDDPSGLTGWHRSGLPGLPEDYCDDWAHHGEGTQFLGIPHRFNEANSFQTDDGVVHMMMRNENNHLLGVTESRDNGETWSKPMLTSFTNSISRSHFGRLPDGRFFCLNCPVRPAPGTKTSLASQAPRTPLVLALSADGVLFDRHYILGDEPEFKPSAPGLYKHGRYGYPYLGVANGKGYAIYSRYKEDICVGRFNLSDLD